jgi:hypothetical protein
LFQSLLEEQHLVLTPPEPAQLTFGLLRSAFSLYLRMCIHKRCADKGGGDSHEEMWFVSEVKEVLGWCAGVLPPHLDETIRLVWLHDVILS